MEQAIQDKTNLPKESESCHIVYTDQQITDHCDKIDNLCLTAHPDGKLMFESLAVIGQLINKIAVLNAENQLRT